jgi:hypothetical protein
MQNVVVLSIHPMRKSKTNDIICRVNNPIWTHFTLTFSWTLVYDHIGVFEIERLESLKLKPPEKATVIDCAKELAVKFGTTSDNHSRKPIKVRHIHDSRKGLKLTN